ncbi:LLM class flavin-dependent oxidoreductase [Alkalibacillus salilacus]|uniref:Luciferase family oxidoreductase group 1 n=1 Tax=Alkalibacillus salilacus TaxID=284582 RepID=A0ABT9VD38_9BACI|nr:LLM class flavin-dependent oxidoreductase [Alkalibacillus salilacus]MDQ0158890.1 luciferase family oxidoreductase group 1 [Alkalibacillus salilacus]
MTNLNIPLSVLNLAPVREGGDQKQAIDDLVDLAQATEEMGYERYWIAEHHNTPTLVSSATSMLIKHTLENTNSIRVGSGGVMLPNHSPLIVAEQFGTMETLYPNRVDLGLGRAPGTDQLTASAIRRSNHDAVHDFPSDIKDLLQYFGPENKQGYVKAFPGVGKDVPLYILGSSTDSARLAANLGLPYAFAAHFAPHQMDAAIDLYRRNFQPSEYLSEPYMMICLNVIAAETDEEAKFEKTTLDQFFLNVVRGTSNPLSPPDEDVINQFRDAEWQMVHNMSKTSLVGSPETIKEQLTQFQSRYDIDELMAVTYIYDRDKQKRSYQILKDVVDGNV